MTETRDDELRQFFHERIAPIAEALRQRGIQFFPLGPDPERRSYWQPRQHGEGYVFQVGDNLDRELHALWREHADLQSLSSELAEMARRLGEQPKESAEVSSFIYAMF